MKVMAPTALLSEAADVLAPVPDDVVVIGAAAVEVALAETESTAIEPTRDVDLVVPTERAAEVVEQLERAELQRSDVPYERGFTWVRGDIKVQLVRTFHPFPKPPADTLPANPAVGIASNPVHQVVVAFADDPSKPRLRCANAACTLALKQAAFGRTHPPDDRPVERDYHDAYLLMSSVPAALAAEFEAAEHEVRQRVLHAVSELAAGARATIAAARQMVRLDTAESQREAEAAVRRTAMRIQRQLGR